MKFVHSNASMYSSIVCIMSSVAYVNLNIFIIGLCKTERYIKHHVLEQTFIFTSAPHVQLNTCQTFWHYL
jgi:hypothetical protein